MSTDHDAESGTCDVCTRSKAAHYNRKAGARLCDDCYREFNERRVGELYREMEAVNWSVIDGVGVQEAAEFAERLREASRA
jgi:hypothetical protein